MEKILQHLIDNNFVELDGLIAHASIPVSEQLANEIIAMTLQENPQLEYCRVKIHTENRITCDVKSPRWPWPFKAKLRLFSEVDLAGSPTIRAFLENYVLLGQLGSLFNVLPQEIRIYKDQVAVDLGALLKLQDQKSLLELVDAIAISTEDGKIFIYIRIRK